MLVECFSHQEHFQFSWACFFSGTDGSVLPRSVPANTKPSNPKARLKAAYETYLAAWKDKDYAALNRLLSNDYQAVNFQGIVSTKAHEIVTAREDRTYETLSGDVMSVAVFGNSAVASGPIEARWKDERGSVQKLTLRFLAML